MQEASSTVTPTPTPGFDPRVAQKLIREKIAQLELQQGGADRDELAEEMQAAEVGQSLS